MYYHCSRNSYNVGDLLQISNYQEHITGEQRQIEVLLENNKPRNKPSRNNSIFCFDCVGNAVIYWSKHPNYIIYEVETDNGPSHIGDYGIIEELFQNGNQEERIALSISYWNGNLRRVSECLFCDQVIVSKIISSDNNIRSVLAAIRRRTWPMDINQRYWQETNEFIIKYHMETYLPDDYMRYLSIEECRREYGY